MIESPENFQIIYGLSGFLVINLLYLINFMHSKNRKFGIAFVAFMLIALIVGLRGEMVGLDTKVYAEFFAGLDRELDEPFFLLIRSLTFYSPNFSFLIVAVLTFVLFFMAYKKISHEYTIYVALFLSTFMLINLSINVMRQGFAMAIFAYATSMLMKASYKKYWGLCVLATLTHFSAVVPALFMGVVSWYEKQGKNALMPIALLSGIFFFIDIADILEPFAEYSVWISRVYWYFSWGITQPWKFKHIYFLIFGLLVLIWLADKFSKIAILDQLTPRFAFVALSTGFMLVFLFKKEELVADRIFYYFIFFVPILINSVLDIIRPRIVSAILLLAGLNIWFFKSIYLQYPGWFIPPYESIRF